MIDQGRPIVCRSCLAKNDADPLCTRIDYSLDVGAAERRAIFLAREFGQHHIGDLVDKLVVITVLLH